jgi:hypothetical protein
LSPDTIEVKLIEKMMAGWLSILVIHIKIARLAVDEDLRMRHRALPVILDYQ